jgi:DNA-binding IclR family transcriptional regulator
MSAGLTWLIRPLAVMTLIKNLGRHTTPALRSAVGRAWLADLHLREHTSCCTAKAGLNAEGHHTFTKTVILRTVPIESHGDALIP